jgi:hypothetical protein
VLDRSFGKTVPVPQEAETAYFSEEVKKRITRIFQEDEYGFLWE